MLARKIGQQQCRYNTVTQLSQHVRSLGIDHSPWSGAEWVVFICSVSRVQNQQALRWSVMNPEDRFYFVSISEAVDVKADSVV